MSNEHNTQTNYSEPSDGMELIPTILKIKRMILLRHSEFIQLLDEFNKTIETFTRNESHYLRFTIVPRTDSTILWKALIRIACAKILRSDQSKSDEIILNLQQFLSVHHSLCQQIFTLQKCPSTSLFNSAAMETNQNNTSSFSTANLSFNVPNDNECCICMDRQPNLVLPCTHKFCDECFHQWSSQTTATSSQTCPLCREDVNSDSGFLLAEKPKYDSVKQMLTESILSLPVDYKTRTNNQFSTIRSSRE